MKLFDEIPSLRGKKVYLRDLKEKDVDIISEISKDKDINRYLPSFLYEHKYNDKSLIIKNYYEECFKTKDSILLSICLNDNTDKMVGILELYHYKEEKNKISIGCRLCKNVWNKGIAQEVLELVLDYLKTTDIKIITAHVMVGNESSQRVLEKSGFKLRYGSVYEDFGRDEPVLVNKYIYTFE